MLEADDSERACIPTKLQLANFCQLRKAEIGQKLSVAVGRNRPRSCRSWMFASDQERTIDTVLITP